MDIYLVLIFTFFAVLIGGFIWWSGIGSAKKSVQSFDLGMSQEEVAEMQIEEILAKKGVAKPEGHSFRFDFPERTAYEELKAASAPSAAAGGGEESEEKKEMDPEAKKTLEKQLFKRCVSVLEAYRNHDIRVRVLIDEYNEKVPPVIVHYVNGIRKNITDEMDAVKAEANDLKENWGENIFKMAIELTIGLEQRKQARLAAEQKAVDDVKKKEGQKIQQQQNEAAKKEAEKRKADKVFEQLMKQEASSSSNKKGTGATSSSKK